MSADEERIRELKRAGHGGIRAARGLAEIAEAERDQWHRRAERVEAAAREVYGPCPEWPECADDEGPCLACAQWAQFLDRAALAPAPESKP